MSRHRGEIFKGKDDLWYFRIKERNGETVCHSEGHKNLGDTRAVLRRLKPLMPVKVLTNVAE